MSIERTVSPFYGSSPCLRRQTPYGIKTFPLLDRKDASNPTAASHICLGPKLSHGHATGTETRKIVWAPMEQMSRSAMMRKEWTGRIDNNFEYFRSLAAG
jgi:hypothetical protein